MRFIHGSDIEKTLIEQFGVLPFDRGSFGVTGYLKNTLTGTVPASLVLPGSQENAELLETSIPSKPSKLGCASVKSGQRTNAILIPYRDTMSGISLAVLSPHATSTLAASSGLSLVEFNRRQTYLASLYPGGIKQCVDSAYVIGSIPLAPNKPISPRNYMAVMYGRDDSIFNRAPRHRSNMAFAPMPAMIVRPWDLAVLIDAECPGETPIIQAPYWLHARYAASLLALPIRVVVEAALQSEWELKDDTNNPGFQSSGVDGKGVTPHSRSGHYRTLRSGKRIWVRKTMVGLNNEHS